MPAPTVEGRATVTDGDTVKIGRHRIRLHGIDAPESQQYCTLGSRQYACGTNVSIRRRPRDCRVRRVRMGGLWWLAESAEERRVGKEGVSTVGSRWERYTKKK